MRKFFQENGVSLLLAVGLLLFIAHYEGQPLLKYAFLPQIGLVMLLITTLALIANRWNTIKNIGLGPKVIWIPLAVIAGSAVLRLLVQQDMGTLAGALFMSSMFGLYVVSRRYGEKALSFFMPVVIIGAISIVVQFFVTGQPKNPGLFSNYATAAEFLVFGWLVSPRKYQWWLSAVVIVGLLLSGAEEGLFYIAVLGIMFLVRKDWSKRILLPAGVIVIILVAGLLTGHIQNSRAMVILKDVHKAITDKSLTVEERDALLDKATDERWSYGWRLHRPILPLGHGLNLVYHYREIPHNIVLLITDQLGPVAMVAWFVAVIGGIRKTKWKYGFVALILFGVFQPFVWTMMAPYMWVMAGTATSSNVQTSYIFRKEAI